MKRRTPLHRIFWHEQRRPDDRRPAPLARETRTDVVVVGGGVAGLTCAQALGAKGAKVVLLEGDTCGAGASGRSSGFVTPDSELELSDLIRHRGPEEAKRLWEFALGGVNAIRENVEGHRIDCDFQVQDSLFVASSRKGARVVECEHGARTKLGYESTLYDSATIRSVLGADRFFGGVSYPGTFGINPYLYCRAMRDVLGQYGVAVHEQSPVRELGEGRVVANGYAVRADVVVLCLDRFLPEVGVLSKEVYHAQTFLAVSAPLPDAHVAAIFPERPRMVWDTDLIYQYFRITGDQRLLLGASSLLYTYGTKERAVAPRVLRKMRAWLARRFPQVPIDIEYFWPGLIGVSKDFLPLAARDAQDPKLCVIGGAAGLPWAAALGRYIAEKIVSDRSDFDAAFDPHRRFPVGPGVQAVVGQPKAFALSHGIVKYLR